MGAQGQKSLFDYWTQLKQEQVVTQPSSCWAEHGLLVEKEAPTVGPERGKSLRRNMASPLLKMGRATCFVVAVSMFSLGFWKRNKPGSRTHTVVVVNAGERCAAIVSKTEWRQAPRGSRESTWKSRSIAEKRSVNGSQWDLS